MINEQWSMIRVKGLYLTHFLILAGSQVVHLCPYRCVMAKYSNSCKFFIDYDYELGGIMNGDVMTVTLVASPFSQNNMLVLWKVDAKN